MLCTGKKLFYSNTKQIHTENVPLRRNSLFFVYSYTTVETLNIACFASYCAKEFDSSRSLLFMLNYAKYSILSFGWYMSLCCEIKQKRKKSRISRLSMYNVYMKHTTHISFIQYYTTIISILFYFYYIWCTIIECGFISMWYVVLSVCLYDELIFKKKVV